MLASFWERHAAGRARCTRPPTCIVGRAHSRRGVSTPTGVDHRPVRDTASVQSVTIERAVSEISVNGRAESCSREATVGRGRGAWSVWRPLLTRSGVFRERPAGAEVVSVPWKPARRIRPAMRRRVRVIVNVCAQCAFVCVCARVRVWLASAGMLLCAPSSIPHCGVCTTAA